MATRDNIIELADQLIRGKGYNAFSFNDISKSVGIKTASIHYHFPTKSDLGIAVIQDHIARFEKFKKDQEKKSPLGKIEAFLLVYSKIKSENKVCLVGSLAPDLKTLDKSVAAQLSVFTGKVLNWLTEVLKEGEAKKSFKLTMPPRTKALMIITNILAILQLSRLTEEGDFELVKENIIKELKPLI